MFFALGWLVSAKTRLARLEVPQKAARPLACYWEADGRWSVNREAFTREEFVARFGCTPEGCTVKVYGAPLRFADL